MIVLNAVVSLILKFITDQSVISEDKEVQDFYRYGIEITISSFLNIFLVLTLGIIIHHFFESIVYLALFIIVRSITGGYHADTYFRCNLLMCVTFTLTTIFNQFTRNNITKPYLIMIVLISELIVSIYSPVENENKPIKESKKHYLKIAGIIVTLVLNVYGVLTSYNYMSTMIIYTIFLIAILIVAAKIKEKRGEKNEKNKKMVR